MNEIEKLTKEIIKAPEDHVGYVDRAKLYMKNRMNKEALLDVEKAIELYPNSPELHNLRERILVDYPLSFQFENGK